MVLPLEPGRWEEAPPPPDRAGPAVPVRRLSERLARASSSSPAERRARWALGTGIAAWALLPCLAGTVFNLTRAQDLSDKPPGYALGYYGAMLAFGLLPFLAAGCALGLGGSALGRANVRRRGEAWVGIALGAGKLALAGALCLVALAGWLQSSGGARRPSGPPLREDEVRVFGEELARTLAAGDSTLFLERLDVDAVLERALPGRPLSRAERWGFGQGLRKGEWARMGEQLRDVIADGGSYRLLRAEVAPAPRVVLRLIGENGLNYHEVAVTRGADGGVSCADLQLLWGGLSLSQSARLALARTPADRRRVQEAQRLLTEERYPQALTAIERLPAALQTERDVLTLRLRAAQAVGGEAYLRALDAVEQALAGQTGLETTLFDLHWERGDHPRCLAAIDGIERAVGGDPYLDVLRAVVHEAAGDTGRALDQARRAAAGAPELQQVWWTLLRLAVIEEDHAATGQALLRLARAFEVDPQVLEEEVDLSAFADSPEAAAWEEYKGGGDPEPRRALPAPPPR